MRTMQQILEAAGYEPMAYSGRGMGGRECLAISGEILLGQLFADVLTKMDAKETNIVARAFRKMRDDSLGRDTVVYFPGIPFEE